MTEIAQLFESALQHNRASLLRKAAINTVARMPPTTKLRDLLNSEAGASIRQLTLEDIREALGGFCKVGTSQDSAKQTAEQIETNESREARVYREILQAIGKKPLTIGQIARKVDIDAAELRGYLAWMKKNGKIDSTGRARATRYHIST